MTLDTVGEFDTRGNSPECRSVRVVFDSVQGKYRIGYGCANTRDTAFEGWTDADWGQPLTAKHAHRRVRSYDTHLRCFVEQDRLRTSNCGTRQGKRALVRDGNTPDELHR